MKKTILLGAAAIMMAFSASAQMSLVKDLAKKATSGNVMEMATVLDQIEPAFTNPESANDVLTWYTAGKAAFGIYDEMYKMKIMQQPVDDKMMNQALSAGFEFFQKALPLDSVVELDKAGASAPSPRTWVILPMLVTSICRPVIGRTPPMHSATMLISLLHPLLSPMA